MKFIFLARGGGALLSLSVVANNSAHDTLDTALVLPSSLLRHALVHQKSLKKSAEPSSNHQ